MSIGNAWKNSAQQNAGEDGETKGVSDVWLLEILALTRSSTTWVCT